jgi:PKD repeat protein
VTLKNVQSSKDVIVGFVLKEYTITAIQAEGGTITPADLVQVTCGDDASFTIKPDLGNEVHSLIIDGVEMPGQPTYTFENVTENHTISAVFVIPPEPDFIIDLCRPPQNRPVNFEDPSHVCRAPLNYPVQFEDLSKNRPTSWQWEFGDGTISTLEKPTHTYTKTGTYTIKLTVRNAASPEGVSITKENAITITTNPIAKFTIEPENGVVLVGEPVKVIDKSLNAAEKDNVSFAWDFGDGKGGFGDGQGTVTKRNPPPYVYGAPGVYKIGLKVEKPYVATSTDYYYQTVTVIQKPIADFQARQTAPLTVEFTDKSLGFPTQWLWDFDNGSFSYDINPTHVFSKPGDYSVTLRIKSDEGEDKKTIRITVT